MEEEEFDEGDELFVVVLRVEVGDPVVWGD
jgi:hypothetical protein